MSKIISMQDMRTSLAAIADQAQAGEIFVVIRNSKPVFKIIPPGDQKDPPGNRALSLRAITGKLDAQKEAYDLSPNDLDRIIHETHERYGSK